MFFYFNRRNMDYIKLFAYDGSWLRVVNVVCAWIILASKAEPKSNEK